MEISQPQWSNRNKNYDEVESSNVSYQKEVKRQKVELQGEFRKIKPHTFDGVEEEVAEVWLINMNKYFQVYEYSSNLKAKLAIFQLREKATLWWEEVKNIHNIDDQDVTWDAFQQYFKDKYLIECFYDEKSREFHDLKLGKMKMDEYITNFTSLLRYVPYLRDEKGKVYWFLSCFLIHMKERIEFVNPKTMDEAIRKTRMCYQQAKAKGELGKNWQTKKEHKGSFGFKKNRTNNYKSDVRSSVSKQFGRTH